MHAHMFGDVHYNFVVLLLWLRSCNTVKTNSKRTGNLSSQLLRSYRKVCILQQIQVIPQMITTKTCWSQLHWFGAGGSFWTSSLLIDSISQKGGRFQGVTKTLQCRADDKKGLEMDSKQQWSVMETDYVLAVWSSFLLWEKRGLDFKNKAGGRAPTMWDGCSEVKWWSARLMTT